LKPFFTQFKKDEADSETRGSVAKLGKLPRKGAKGTARQSRNQGLNHRWTLMDTDSTGGNRANGGGARWPRKKTEISSQAANNLVYCGAETTEPEIRGSIAKLRNWHKKAQRGILSFQWPLWSDEGIFGIACRNWDFVTQ
jgi:hypothetical protein